MVTRFRWNGIARVRSLRPWNVDHPDLFNAEACARDTDQSVGDVVQLQQRKKVISQNAEVEHWDKLKTNLEDIHDCIHIRKLFNLWRVARLTEKCTEHESLADCRSGIVNVHLRDVRRGTLEASSRRSSIDQDFAFHDALVFAQ